MRVIVGRLVSSDFTRIAWRAVPAISSPRNNTDLQAEGDDYFMIGRNRWRTKLSLRTHFRNIFRNFEGTDSVVVITDPIQQSRQARRGNLFLLFFFIVIQFWFFYDFLPASFYCGKNMKKERQIFDDGTRPARPTFVGRTVTNVFIRECLTLFN